MPGVIDTAVEVDIIEDRGNCEGKGWVRRSSGHGLDRLQSN